MQHLIDLVGWPLSVPRFPVGAMSLLMTALCTLATCVGVHLRLVCHALRTRPLGSAI